MYLRILVSNLISISDDVHYTPSYVWLWNENLYVIYSKSWIFNIPEMKIDNVPFKLKV